MSTEDNRSKSPGADDAQSRKKHPCVLCQQRKVKCDRNHPCQNCIKAKIECVPASALPPKRRKKRFPEAELITRLRRYEEHLKGYGADIDAINREEGPAVPKTHDIKHSHAPHNCGRPPDFMKASLSVRRSLKHVENNLLNGLNKEFRDAEEILQGSSDDETFESPITKTYDAIGSDAGDLLFPGDTPKDLINLHPPAVHIFRLWQTFIDNVNPLIKVIHAPTVQQQILEASVNLGKVSKGTEVLMFGIYATATMSLTEEEVKTNFGEEKATLLSRYQSGCRQALLRAGFLRSSDMTILQGLLLYLISSLNFSIDPRALFCLTGISMRIGQRMGLNIDGTSHGLLPFEVEMRRRLWWQLLLLDSRVGELSGFGPSLHMHMHTTKLPSNVNDSSLFPDMKNPPMENQGATEMLFVLQRCEVAQFLYQSRRLCGPAELNDGTIDTFEAMLQTKYFAYCDPQVPLHFLSLKIAKSAICRLRMGSQHPHLPSNRGENMTDHEKEKVFILGLSMLEDHHVLMSTTNLSGFLWYVYTNFPFPAHVYLICALRSRTTGELADRAWKQLSLSVERQRRFRGDTGRERPNNTLRMALSNLTIKAWEAREAALRLYQPTVTTPSFIIDLREMLASRKTPNSTPQSESEPVVTGNVFGNQDDPYQWLNQQPLDGAAFDQSTFAMPDSAAMDWSFWNGTMQAPMSNGFEHTMPQGFYQT